MDNPQSVIIFQCSSVFVLPDCRRRLGNGGLYRGDGGGKMLKLYANYYGQETALLEFWGMIFQSDVDGNVTNFVVSDDGSVYLKGVLSSYPTTTWIKGTRAEGDTIVFNFPQRYESLTQTTNRMITICTVWH